MSGLGKAAGTQALIAALLRTAGSGNGLPMVSQGAASGQRWDLEPRGRLMSPTCTTELVIVGGEGRPKPRGHWLLKAWVVSCAVLLSCALLLLYVSNLFNEY